MQIHWKNGKNIEEEHRQTVERRLETLAEQGNDLMDVMITSKSTSHHRHGGEEIHIVCRARGRSLVATRSRPDASQALFDALGALEREIRDLRSRRSEHRGRGSKGERFLEENAVGAEEADAELEPFSSDGVE